MTTPGSAQSPAGWPGLGFDPAPGDPAFVRALTEQLGVAAGALQETRAAYEKLRTPGSTWTGTAAEAFSSRSAELPAYTDTSRTALDRARTALDGWSATLTEHQKAAQELEAEARRIREQLAAAEQAYERARTHPDFALASRTYTDQAALDDANRRITAANQALSDAGGRVSTLDADLEQIVRRAVSLENRHELEGGRTAKVLADVDDGIPPPDPEWYAEGGSTGDIANSIGDVAGVVSAAAGALALFPGLTFIAGPVALAAGGVALAGHSISMAQKGSWNFYTLGSDVLGVIPGAKTIGATIETVSSATTAARIAREAGDTLTAAREASRARIAPLREPFVASAKFDEKSPYMFSSVVPVTGIAGQAPTVKDWTNEPFST
ncbi:hypothetical protein [Pseudonocardia sp. HH130630-07]|uniref:hypothetical protein n=1 Tax=Pseudonocardia sp. HH130630-07 TaxID=1690815 RepID=UPI0008151580|nr:hypothetical protein [Pseudonocardia sp. HH130630-07]ANY06628.1 hypothetical protein AFB00_10350 [Pseudonocardia sp. HH130630-07]